MFVFIVMVSAFLAESFLGDRTQEQELTLKTGKSAVEIHPEYHDIYVATETGGYLRAVRQLLRAPAQKQHRRKE